MFVVNNLKFSLLNGSAKKFLAALQTGQGRLSEVFRVSVWRLLNAYSIMVLESNWLFPPTSEYVIRKVRA